MSAFGTLLDRLIIQSGHTQESWAARVGLTQGQVSNLVAGRRKPNLSAVDAWAESFGLAGDARNHFRRLAMAARLPPEMCAEMEALIDEAEKAKRPRQ